MSVDVCGCQIVLSHQSMDVIKYCARALSGQRVGLSLQFLHFFFDLFKGCHERSP
jgi:hypothetical protein